MRCHATTTATARPDQITEVGRIPTADEIVALTPGQRVHICGAAEPETIATIERRLTVGDLGQWASLNFQAAGIPADAPVAIITTTSRPQNDTTPVVAGGDQVTLAAEAMPTADQVEARHASIIGRLQDAVQQLGADAVIYRLADKTGLPSREARWAINQLLAKDDGADPNDGLYAQRLVTHNAYLQAQHDLRQAARTWGESDARTEPLRRAEQEARNRREEAVDAWIDGIQKTAAPEAANLHRTQRQLDLLHHLRRQCWLRQEPCTFADGSPVDGALHRTLLEQSTQALANRSSCAGGPEVGSPEAADLIDWGHRLTLAVHPPEPLRVDFAPGDRHTVTLPFSEACMHLQVAGRSAEVQLSTNGREAQIFIDGRPYSTSILPAEAGLLEENGKRYGYLRAEQTELLKGW